jgi:WD40 repeat-containing protein SMU1
MRENNLPQSLKSLERETNLTLNTIDNIETFLNDIKHGRWDTVLKQLQPLTIEDEKLFDLHEQVSTFNILDKETKD